MLNFKVKLGFVMALWGAVKLPKVLFNTGFAEFSLP